jgi:hypothetical protein
VGKNLASMELVLIIASLFRRYDVALEDPDAKVGGRNSVPAFFCAYACWAVGDARGIFAEACSVSGWDQTAGLACLVACEGGPCLVAGLLHQLDIMMYNNLLTCSPCIPLQT